MARDLSYHDATVVSSERLTPGMHRLVLDVPGWRSSGDPDEALLLVVPGDDGRVVRPDDVPDGDDQWARTRWYTVRRHDPGAEQMTVDVVVHDHGLACGWAQDARPGDRVGVSSTHSWYARPEDAAWQLLVGDVVALPAIGRIVQESPHDVETVAVVEVAGPQDEQPELGPTVRWHHNPDLARRSDLADLVAGLDLPDGPGYVYVAGEAGATRAARKHLRHERGLAKGAYAVVGYWRLRREEWMDRFERSGIDLEQVYAEGERAGMDEEELSDEVDRRLDAAGL